MFAQTVFFKQDSKHRSSGGRRRTTSERRREHEQRREERLNKDKHKKEAKEERQREKEERQREKEEKDLKLKSVRASKVVAEDSKVSSPGMSTFQLNRVIYANLANLMFFPGH